MAVLWGAEPGVRWGDGAAWGLWVWWRKVTYALTATPRAAAPMHSAFSGGVAGLQRDEGMEGAVSVCAGLVGAVRGR